jgi:hypothetical protein
MIRINNIRRNGFLCLLLLVSSCYAIAQNVVFTAGVSSAKIGVQDQVQVQYTIQNASNLQSLNPPGTLQQDFNILGGPYSSQSTSVQIVNGRMVQTSGLSITYVLQPKRTGNLTIGPAVAKDATGHTYQSNSVPIQVVPGSLAVRQQQQRGYDPFGDDDPFAAIMQQRQRQLQALRQQQAQPQAQPQQAPVNNQEINKNIFIKVAVDKNKVHVGEQITASYKLYARLPMNVNISKLPSLNGFWTQDFEMPKGNIKPVEEIVDGKKYQVFTLKKSALFPQQTGNLELDPAEAEGIVRIVQQVKQSNPFGNDPFFQSFGSLLMSDPFFNDDFFSTMAYRDVKVHLKSSPVRITVTSLPEEGKPADYGNAVGNFSIASKIDRTELTTDDVANLKLTITGSGNLKLIEAPKLHLPNGLDSYDPQITDTITGRTTTITGSKIINYAIAPNTAGDYVIPAIPFSYYNPQTGKYATLTTQPVTIHVKQGKGSKNDIAKGTSLVDIHNIDKRPLKNVTLNSKPILFTVGYWSMYALPFLLFMGVAVWKRKEEEDLKDTVQLRNKRANKVALKRLVTAQKLLQQNKRQPFYEEVSKAIWLYLSDKLYIPLSSLSREKAVEMLTLRKVPSQLQQNIDKIIDDCEISLYAGAGSSQMNQTYKDAVDVISKLEETL